METIYDIVIQTTIFESGSIYPFDKLLSDFYVFNVREICSHVAQFLVAASGQRWFRLELIKCLKCHCASMPFSLQCSILLLMLVKVIRIKITGLFECRIVSVVIIGNGQMVIKWTWGSFILTTDVCII